MPRFAKVRHASRWPIAAVAVTTVLAAHHHLSYASSTTTSSSLSGYDCIADGVVVDPDDELVDLDAGCPITVEFEFFGPGGTFDAFLEDDAGGGGGYDIIGASNGDRFTLDYTPPDVLPEEITIYVDLDPHSPDYVCTGYSSRGATGYKTIFPGAATRDCVVSFRVPEAVDLGSLRFEVDYSPAAGKVPGCQGGARCSFRLAEASTVIDRDEQLLLDVRAASGLGFSTPAEIVHCDFKLDAAENVPTADDFVVAVTDAAGPPPLRKPIERPPAIEVAVECPPGPTTTTTLPEDPAGCGHPCTAGLVAEPTVRDALYALQAAVGSVACASCICDVNRSGSINASDALTILARAVGLDALVRCVKCAAPLSVLCE